MNLRQRLLLTGLRGAGTLLERGSRLFFHAAIGALERDALDRIRIQEWDDFRLVSPARMGLHDWEQEFFKKWLKPNDRVFVVGCGGGRVVVGLLESGGGYLVDGADPAPQAIRDARRAVAERDLTSRLEVSGIEDCALDGEYDAFVFAWFSYQYIPGRLARIDALRRAACHLRPGGRILLCHSKVVAGPREISNRLARAVAHLSSSDWIPEFGDLLFGGARGFGHYEHVFQPGERESEARDAGLELVYEAHVSDNVVIWALEAPKGMKTP